MAQVWQPQEAGLVQLCHLLSEVQKPGANQAQILQQLEEYRNVADFNNYLSYIFAKGDQLPVEVRQSAGLLLKNNLKLQYASTTEDFRNYIKGDLLHVLSHPERPLRHTAGSIITTIVGSQGLAVWPELVMSLGHGMGSSDASTLDGALDTLAKVVEDHPQQMDVMLTGASWPAPTSVSCLLVPALLKLMQHPAVDVRKQAIAVLNMMLQSMPAGLSDAIETYAQGLFVVATDPAPSVRREVCIGLVQMLLARPDVLVPHLGQLIEYMLTSNQDGDEGVALESCEFWLAFMDAEVEAAILRPFLPKLIPILLKNMAFDEFDEEVQEAEAYETAGPSGQEDEDKDIKPTHHRVKGNAPGTGEEDGDADDDDDDGDMRKWTLRKCSASGLDMLSATFGDEILPVLLPLVEQRLQEADWHARESAILALGAVCEGCVGGLSPHVHGIVAMLLPRLEDPRPMVRIISAWALARYSHWLLVPPGSGGGGSMGQQSPGGAVGGAVTGPGTPSGQLFEAVLAGILRRVLDSNRSVQQAACSAQAALHEHAGAATRGAALLPALPAIVNTLATAASKYGRRNMRALLDTIVTLASVVGPPLGDPQLLARLMPSLLDKWSKVSPLSRDLIPFTEALASLAIHLRARFEQYAPPLLEKALQVAMLQQDAKAAAGAPGAPAYEPELRACALDLISGLAEGLGPSLDPLIANGPLIPLVAAAAGDDEPEVRQSGFALLGDLARACIGRVAPQYDDWVGLCLHNLEAPMLVQEAMSACNNACWSLGELSIKVRPELVERHALRAAETMAFILCGGPRVTQTLKENAAITLGRLAWVAPGAIAPHLSHFASAWCNSLRSIRDDVEKEQAFRGLLAVVRMNPEPAVASFQAFVGALASWRHIQAEDLRHEVVNVLRTFRESLSPSGRWGQLLAGLEPKARDKLAAMCGQL